MKKTLFAVVFCLICNLTFGQKTAYFDRTFHDKNDDSKRNNRREYTIKDSIIEIKDYKKTKLFRVGAFYGFSDLDNLDEYIYYLSNRNVEKSSKLITDNRGGFIKYRFNNLAIAKLFIEDKANIMQVWSDGKEMLINGSGKYENKFPFNTETGVGIVKDSVQVESYIVRKRKNDTIYSILNKKAYPVNGVQEFYNQLTKTNDYEKISKKLEIDIKKIWLKFIVDKDGHLTDFFIMNKKGFKLGRKDIKKLESMQKWKPAIFNGMSVKTRFYIPLTLQPDLIKHYF